MTEPICWLASYPKSGNTWVRFLLHQYLFGRVSDSREIAGTIPSVHIPHRELVGRVVNGAIVTKTHHRLSARMPYVDRTRSAIYLARHPRSVIRSSFNYLRLVSPPEIAARIEAGGYVRNFIRLGGDPLFIQHGFGSMLEHAGAWLSHPTMQRLIVRYEDLRERPEAELARMLHFLGVEPDQDRIAGAVEDSSFERMRALESEEKGRGLETGLFDGPARRVREGRYFMNAGTVGGSLDEIAPGLDALVDERFAWFLERFGYERIGEHRPAHTTSV